MKPLRKSTVDAIANAATDAEKVQAAAAAMVEKPMELIHAILLKHEQAVLEVMWDLRTQRDALLEACKAALSDDQPYIEKCRAAIARAEEKS